MPHMREVLLERYASGKAQEEVDGDSVKHKRAEVQQFHTVQ